MFASLSKYTMIVSKDVIRVKELVDHWTELQDLITLAEDAEERETYLEESEAIENFFDDLGFENVETLADNPYGETYNSDLISDSFFPEYVMKRAKEDIPQDLPSYIEIDWNETVEKLKTGYYYSADIPLDAELPNGVRITFHIG